MEMCSLQHGSELGMHDPVLALLTGVLINTPISRSATFPYPALPLESRVEKLPVPRP